MKKINFILAAFAAVFALSCNKEITNVQTPDDSVPAGMKMVTLTATAEGATKTTYTDNGEGVGVFSWTRGDQISVWCSDDMYHTFTAESNGASVSFSGIIPEDVFLGWYAFYPADENHAAGCKFSIPQYKDLSNQFSADLPMAATVVEDVYTFTHITGAALLTFTNFPDFVKTAEISIVNARMGFSGLFSAYTTSEGYWNWSSQVDVSEDERTFIRKVPVVDNEAQVYLPYNGSLWWDYKSIINITGFDASGDEYELLVDKTMKPDEKNAVRAHVVPYAPLALPDYIPPVDWTDENIPTYVLPESASSSRQVLRKMQYCADVNKLNIRLTASISKLNETNTGKLTFAIFDKTNGEGDGLWGWWGNAKGDVQYVAEGKAIITGTDLTVSISEGVEKEIEGDLVTWTFAIPRTVNDVFNNSSVYIGILSLSANDATGAIPDKYGNMLEVTLP